MYWGWSIMVNQYHAEVLTKLFDEGATNKPWEVMKVMKLVPPPWARVFFPAILMQVTSNWNVFEYNIELLNVNILYTCE